MHKFLIGLSRRASWITALNPRAFFGVEGWALFSSCRVNELVVYILHYSDSSYYIGHTEDPEARLLAHNCGKGPGYTAARRPVVLLYTESHPTKESAQK